MDKELSNDPLTFKIIGAAIEVHKHIGPGLLESSYEHCLAHEFLLRNISFRRQIEVPVIYKNQKINDGYKLDFIVEEKVIVELKTVSELISIHNAQLITYLKLMAKPVGLLINFNVEKLIDGVKRIVL